MQRPIRTCELRALWSLFLQWIATPHDAVQLQISLKPIITKKIKKGKLPIKRDVLQLNWITQTAANWNLYKQVIRILRYLQAGSKFLLNH